MNDFARGALTSRQTPFFCSLHYHHHHAGTSSFLGNTTLLPCSRASGGAFPESCRRRPSVVEKKRAGPVAARTSLSSGSSVPPTSVTLQRSEQRQPAVR
ncbi:hypothetical protein MRX96_054080 [Rhipicephalus microplus]